MMSERLEAEWGMAALVSWLLYSLGTNALGLAAGTGRPGRATELLTIGDQYERIIQGPRALYVNFARQLQGLSSVGLPGFRRPGGVFCPTHLRSGAEFA